MQVTKMLQTGTILQARNTAFQLSGQSGIRGHEILPCIRKTQFHLCKNKPTVASESNNYYALYIHASFTGNHKVSPTYEAMERGN